MQALTEDKLIDAFKIIGLQKGDVVFVHSDLRGFGIPHQLKNKEDILKFYFQAFKKVLGKEGTLAVPAYFYEYARFGLPFDVDRSPVSASLGAFSQWFVSQPDCVRSCNPLQSVAAIGKQAVNLAGGDSLSGYGVTSPWHYLRQLKGKILFLGALLQSMTFVHYIEQHYGVPHLYFKIYPYPVFRSGKQLSGHPISAVRYLDYKIEYDISPFQRELEKQKALTSYSLNQTTIQVVDAEMAFQIGIACLNQNPYFFLKQPPVFVSDQIPIDRIIGKNT